MTTTYRSHAPSAGNAREARERPTSSTPPRSRARARSLAQPLVSLQERTAALLVAVVLAVLALALVVTDAHAARAHGSVYWHVRHNTTTFGTDWFGAAHAPGGTLYVLGERQLDRHDREAGYVGRVGPGARVQWTRRVGTWKTGDTDMVWCASDASGALAVAGMYSDDRRDVDRVVVAKYGPSGRLLWLRPLMPKGYDVLITVGDGSIGRLGTVYVSFTALSLERLQSAGFVAAFQRSTGELLWCRAVAPRLARSQASECDAVVTDGVGNLYAAGSVLTQDATAHLFLRKLTANGRAVWQRSWPAPDGRVIDFARVVFSGHRAFAAAGTMDPEAVRTREDSAWPTDATATRVQVGERGLILASCLGSGSGAWSRDAAPTPYGTWLGDAIPGPNGSVLLVGQAGYPDDEPAQAFASRWNARGRHLWTSPYAAEKGGPAAGFATAARVGTSVFCTGYQFRDDDRCALLTARMRTDGGGVWRTSWDRSGRYNARGQVILAAGPHSLWVMGESGPAARDCGEATVWKIRR